MKALMYALLVGIVLVVLLMIMSACTHRGVTAPSAADHYANPS